MHWLYFATVATIYCIYDIQGNLSSGLITFEGCFWILLADYLLVDLLSGKVVCLFVCLFVCLVTKRLVAIHLF